MTLTELPRLERPSWVGPKSAGSVPLNMQPEASLPIASNNKSVSWENLAAQAHYQPVKMAELCSVSLRTVQLTEWLRSIRMGEAKRRILAGDSIKAVAFDLGFKQLSHFSRVFKESYGVAPSLLLQIEAGSRLPTKLYSSQ